MQIRLGKIKLGANLESNGVIFYTMFSDNSTSSDNWNEFLVESCSDNDTIADGSWWKVVC